ncbi:MAG: hypothetical protein ACOC33_00290 [bacterium]
MAKQIDYAARTFVELRTELFGFIKKYYPETLSSFSDSDIGTLLVELVAGLGDSLFFAIDRAANENLLEYAQQRQQILEIAKTLGLKIPSKRASVTVLDWSVILPVKGDTYNSDYAPVLKAGGQAIGGGRIFETVSDIDFNSPVSSNGNPNLIIIPNLDSNGIIQNYTLTKREVAFNGRTKIFKRILTNGDIQPFFELTLPDNDVLSIEQVIVLPGTNYTTNPTLSQFRNEDNRYYEVESLAQQKIFTENDSLNTSGDSSGLKAGRWKYITRKFVKEFTSNGFCKLIFGGGNGDLDLMENAVNSIESGDTFNVFRNYLENTSLGEIPQPNSTMFIRYRVGGGINSNIGANVLTSTGDFDLVVSGDDDRINRFVSRSLTVNNPIPALGGADEPSIEEIRRLAMYNFSARNRGVVLNDYINIIGKMDGQFGSPFKITAYEENNKIVIPILGLGVDGKLNNSSTSRLKENISEYLSEFRMINDYVEIKDGKIFNLAFDFELYIENVTRSEVSARVIQTIIDYFDINKFQINQDVFMNNLLDQINGVDGVINIIDFKVFNKVNGQYSLNEIEMPYLPNTSRQIELINNTLYSSKDSIFEIKFPSKDIRLFLRTRREVNQ